MTSVPAKSPEPKPAPERCRIMKLGEELEPGESWEPLDGHVPKAISTPQPKHVRFVGGFRVLPDAS